MKPIVLQRKFFVWQIDKLFGVLAGTFLLPFIFHVIPQSPGQPLGGLWLPIFYAPLVAVIWYRPHVAWMGAVAAPWLNWALLGMPTFPVARLLTAELVVFVLTAQLIMKMDKRLWVLGPVAYVGAKVFSVMVLQGQDWTMIGPSLLHAKAGLFMLGGIGWLAVRENRKDGA